ncbi:MAG: hypothetical protein IIC67_10390 [Thaumarchaeota archaeon]|nr:hypothetical protein [Nitrososphaerota archaeon]
MVSRKAKIFIVVSIALFTLGFLFISGVLTQPEVHLFTHEFDYQDGTAYLTLRFESETGVYTVGQEIIIDAFLALPEFSNQDNKFHLLYFPNSFTPSEYKELLKRENFAKVTFDEDGSGFTFDFAPSKIFINLGNFPPQGNTTAIWTQDGPKNAILQIDAKYAYITEKDIEEHGIIIENIITIQSSDVKVQMQSNNITTGLALIITAVTILVGTFSLEKTSTTKDDSKRKK